MASYKIIYIETKNEKTGKWELFHQFGKLENISDIYKSEYRNKNIVQINGIDYVDLVYDSYQGSIRDVLSSNDLGYNKRNFPNDISDELKNIFDKDKELKVYGYDYSYATLSELKSKTEALKTKYVNDKENFKARIKDQDSSKEISKKLDTIVNYISNIIPNGNQLKEDLNIINKTEEAENFSKADIDFILDDFDDVIEDYNIMLEYLNGVERMVNYAYTYFSENNIRLVYYTE